MIALKDNQIPTKTLLIKTYEHLPLEDVKWCWDWILGECGKWDAVTMLEVLKRWERTHPKALPTLIDLIKTSEARSREIIAKTPAEPVTRTNPHG